MLDKPSSACGCARWFFLGYVLPFSPFLLITPSHMSRNNLERGIKLNNNNEKKNTDSVYDVNVSRDARKPVFGVSDQVRHKPACTVTEAS